MAKHCDLEPYEFNYHKGNCHIYKEHVENIKIQLSREPYEFPTLEIINKRENIEDYCEEDFIINNYKHHEAIKYIMVP